MRQALQFLWIKLHDILAMPSTPRPSYLLLPLSGTPFPRLCTARFRSRAKCYLLWKAFPGHPSLIACTWPWTFQCISWQHLAPFKTITVVFPSVSSMRTWTSSVLFMAVFPVARTVRAHNRYSVNNTRLNKWMKEKQLWEEQDNKTSALGLHSSSPCWENLGTW